MGSTIGRLCADKRLSQSKLAGMVEVNRSHLNQVINGRANPSLEFLVKIADGLDVPLTDLFFGLDELPPREAAKLLATEYDARGD